MTEIHPNPSAVALDHSETKGADGVPAASLSAAPAVSPVGFEDAVLVAAGTPTLQPQHSHDDHRHNHVPSTPSPASSSTASSADDASLSLQRPSKPRPPPSNVAFQGGFVFDTYGV